MFTKILLTAFLLILQVTLNAVSYRNTKNCIDNAHFLSSNSQLQSPGEQCIEYQRTIITERDKHNILNKINNRRNKVASGEIRSYPSAANMMKMEWSENLEVLAQNWADQCVRSSDDVQDPCLNLATTGQNIATVYGEAPGLSPVVLVDVWYVELLHTNMSIMSTYQPSAETGSSHYEYFTQLVWAKSSYVGCGSIKFKEVTNDTVSNRTVNRLVCNFSPAGNQEGESVYAVGSPCSQCPEGSSRDIQYTSLCQSDPEKNNDVTSVNVPKKRNQDNLTVTNAYVSELADPGSDEDNFTPYNYFTEFFQFTSEPTFTTKNGTSCKDVLAVDDFVELVKKRLSNDPMFKELLSSKSNTTLIDNNYSDASVAAFVSKLYSKKEPPTTTKSPETEHINSTLLVDLVEAVIFRTGNKLPIEEVTQPNLSVMAVSPIKIQAELSEVKSNQDFTGHYFFPEDETTQEMETETTETYEDVSDFSIADVVLEIKDIKRDKTTKDFLEEIFESDSGASEKYLIRSKRKVEKNSGKKNIKRHQIYQDSENYEIKYSEILKKVATDLKVLKLNENFHCSRNYSQQCFLRKYVIFNIFLIIFKFLFDS